MTANSLKTQVDKNKNRATDVRRANKPLMEKKRRMRINSALSILKTLVVDNCRDNKKSSKLEKADILDCTVQYLQKKQSLCNHSDEHTFWEGYEECTKSTLKFLESCNIDQRTLDKLIEFLRFRQEPKSNISEYGSKTENTAFDCSDSNESNIPDKEEEICTINPQQSDANAKFLSNNSLSRLQFPGIRKPEDISNLDLPKPLHVVTSTFFPDKVTNSKNYNNFDQPLDLCKYSKMYQDSGVWRPW